MRKRLSIAVLVVLMLVTLSPLPSFGYCSDCGGAPHGCSTCRGSSQFKSNGHHYTCICTECEPPEPRSFWDSAWNIGSAAVSEFVRGLGTSVAILEEILPPRPYPPIGANDNCRRGHPYALKWFGAPDCRYCGASMKE